MLRNMICFVALPPDRTSSCRKRKYSRTMLRYTAKRNCCARNYSLFSHSSHTTFSPHHHQPSPYHLHFTRRLIIFFVCVAGKGTRTTISHLDAIDIPVTPPDARLFRAETRWQSAVCGDTRSEHVLRWPEERHDTLEGSSIVDTR